MIRMIVKISPDDIVARSQFVFMVLPKCEAFSFVI